MLEKYLAREALEGPQCPSAQDGLSQKKAKALRAGAVRLIQGACKELRLSSWVAATGAYFFHRFFGERSMVRNDRFLVSVAAMFLATKVRMPVVETP